MVIDETRARAERDDGVRPGPSSQERDRVRQLGRANRDLRQANEFLRMASAYLAAAELVRLRLNPLER